jgi:hypothetical protein
MFFRLGAYCPFFAKKLNYELILIPPTTYAFKARLFEFSHPSQCGCEMIDFSSEVFEISDGLP